MLIKEQRRSRHQKQTSVSIPSHAASIRSSSLRSALEKKNKPYGTVPPRIQKVEALVEALIALHDDEVCLTESARLLAHIRAQRIHNRRLFLRSSYKAEAYGCGAALLDAAEFRVIREMVLRARRLRECVEPNVRAEIKATEAAA